MSLTSITASIHLGLRDEQAVDLGVDVLLGGGKARFDQDIPAGEPNAGRTVLQTATARGYSVVTTGPAYSPRNSARTCWACLAPAT